MTRPQSRSAHRELFLKRRPTFHNSLSLATLLLQTFSVGGASSAPEDGEVNVLGGMPEGFLLALVLRAEPAEMDERSRLTAGRSGQL